MWKGFAKVYALKGGWREWNKLGFPTVAKASVEEKCISCHADLSPGIVGEWKLSKHNEGGVICSTCHGDEHSSEADVEKVVIPDLESCRRCHQPAIHPNVETWWKAFSETHNPPVR
jgi:uncharacterized CHY-type Zn-finger protein